jgi:hypothetical protein
VGVGAWAGSRHVPGDPATDFAGAAELLAAAGAGGDPLDAVVVAVTVRPSSASNGANEWQRILDEHVGLPERIRLDAGWARAVSDYAAGADRPVRLITVTDAATSDGRSRAQAAVQLARAAHTATSDRVDAFAVSIERPGHSERRTAAELAAHLLCGSDTSVLSGAELVVGPGWFGLRSHPRPATSISYGGPAVPDWLDDTLRRVVKGEVN